MYKCNRLFNGLRSLKRLCSKGNEIGKCDFKVNKNSIFIFNIVVNENHQNKKIGSDLLKEIEQHAFKNNISKILLVSNVKSELLENFYIKNGFIKI